MEEKVYRVTFKFKGQIVFTVEFKGEDNLPPEKREEILLEQAAIMKGERIGITKEWI